MRFINFVSSKKHHLLRPVLILLLSAFLMIASKPANSKNTASVDIAFFLTCGHEIN